MQNYVDHEREQFYQGMKSNRAINTILVDASKSNSEKMEEIKSSNLSNEIAEGFLLNFALGKNLSADDFIDFAKQVVLDNTISIYTLFYMLK
jgi:hypothetical protein